MTMPNKRAPAAPDSFPSESGRFLLPGPAGHIEMAVDRAESDAARAGVAVICHPHPLHGGTMRNKVVTMLERSLRECGLDTVRFNFRGVGGSEGEYDEGRGEADDLAAVVEWVRTSRADDALWLGGFSFGSFVALHSAAPLSADALITVAPPAGREWGIDNIEPMPSCPWLLIQGEADEVVDPADVFAWVDTLEQAPHVVRIPEAGHFFHRRLMDLRGAVKNGVRSWLPAPR